MTILSLPTPETRQANADGAAARPGADKAAALRRQIDGRIDALAKAVDDVRASEAFRALLDVQARFHAYSWHNCMLIAMQCPTASRVAGYRTWQKLGRQVRKGERGIAIFAPCPFHREVASASGESEMVDGVYFRIVHVFDVGYRSPLVSRYDPSRWLCLWA